MLNVRGSEGIRCSLHAYETTDAPSTVSEFFLPLLIPTSQVTAAPKTPALCNRLQDYLLMLKDA